MASAAGIRAGRAYVELFTDDSKLVRGLNSAATRLKSWGAGLSSIGKRAAVGLGGSGPIGAAISEVASTILSPAGITGALGVAALKFADFGSDLNDMSARTGTSVEALSSFKYAAEQTGGSLEDVEGGIRKMQKSLVEAAGGSTEANDALRGIGLSVGQLRNMKPEEQYRAISKGIAGLPNPANRTAVAMQLMGKSATKLLPMMKELSDLEKEAKDAGLILSTEDAKNADALGDAWGKLKQQFTGVIVQTGAALAPALTSLAKVVSENVAVAIGWIRENKGVVVAVAATAAGITAAGATLVGLGMGISLIGTLFSAVATGIGFVGTALGVILSPLGLVVAGVVGLGIYFAKTSGAAGKMKDSLSKSFESLKSNALAGFAAIRNALAAGDIAAAWEVVVSGLKLAWDAGTNWMRSKWIEFKNVFLDTWETATSGLAKLFINAMAGVESAWVSLIGYLDELWSGFTKKVKVVTGAATLAGLNIGLAIDVALGKKTIEEAKTAMGIGRAAVVADVKANNLNTDAELKKRKDARDGQLKKIDEDRKNSNANVDADRDRQLLKNKAAADAAKTELEAGLEAAKKRFNAAVANANEAGAVKKALDEGQKNKESGIEAAEKKLSTSGTFLASSARGLSGGSAADRTARATERTANGVDKLTKKIEFERIG